jgi:hypothetical protein
MSDIFIRNPKCATISIRNVGKRLGFRIDEKDYHQTALEWKQMLPDYDDHFKFTVVRNPYDRLLSGYLFICRRKLPKHREILSRYGTNFEKFVTGLDRDFKMKLTDVDMVTWPQKTWLTDEQGNVIVDKIGHFEDLGNFWKNLCQEKDWQFIPLPKSNATRHGPWTNYYTSEMKEIVQNQYREDFELLDYDMYYPI